MNDQTVSNRKGQLASTNFQWFPAVLFRPRKTTAQIATHDKPAWLAPLLVLSLLVVLLTLIAAPIRKQTIQMGSNLPPDFQYYTPEMQAQFMKAQESQTSPLFLYLFPILSGVAGIWVSWFLMSSILHLLITLSGSRAASLRSYNLVSWSFVPFILRYLVQLFALLFSKSLVQNPGLSGLMAADAGGFLAFLRVLLGLIDLYFIFQVILLFLGVVPLSGLSKSKAYTATLIMLILVLVLRALPGFLSSILGGLSVTRPFFF